MAGQGAAEQEGEAVLGLLEEALLEAPEEDKPKVVAALREKTDQGQYPENLWE